MTVQEQSHLYRKLGFRIRELREKVGIRQGTFARSLDLSRASIVNIEKGRQRPSIHLLLNISTILGVQVMEILTPLETSIRSAQPKLSSEWKKAIKSVKRKSNSKQKLTEFLKEVSVNEATHVS